MAPPSPEGICLEFWKLKQPRSVSVPHFFASRIHLGTLETYLTTSTLRVLWRRLPDELFFDVLGEFVLANVAGEGRAEDLDLLEVGLAHSGLGTVVEVADLGEVDAHQFDAHAVGGQPVGGNHADAMVDRGAAHRAVAFHAVKAVDHGQVGVKPLGQGEQVVVDAVDAAAVDERLLGDLAGRGGPCPSGSPGP